VPVDLAEGQHGFVHQAPTSLEFVLENIPSLLGKRKTYYTLGSRFRELVSVSGVRTSSRRTILMTHHCPIGDQPDKCKWWQETETDDDGIPQSFKVRFIQTRIHDEQEDRRDLGCPT
jgi:hypothetical protein